MPAPKGRAKIRSFHSKSRGGCINCKKRHIKCDQRKPECSNCTTRRLHCPFLDAADSGGTPPKEDAVNQGPSPDSDGTDAPSPLPPGVLDVTVIHLELYNYFIFDVCPTFTGEPRHDENYRKLITRTAFQHHFVLYGMLGLAALAKHLSVPDKTHKTLAASFLEKAITNLDDIITKISSENCVAIIVFAQLIGIHSFCETFASAPTITFPDFLESLIGSTQLLRGVDAVLRPFWNDLASTEIGEFMNDAIQRRLQMVGRVEQETATLHALIQNADISESSRETYVDAISKLQRDFDEVAALDVDQLASTNTAFAWLNTASPGYLQLLGEARPEALVILAYYSVVLHHRRKCWAIGTAGYTLLKSIMAYLGRQWRQWLVWPQSEIGNEFPDVFIENMMI